MHISTIENSYAPRFRPLLHINDDELWLERELAYGRCSAFPFLLKTYEDLVQNVDSLHIDEKQHIINKFHTLLQELVGRYTVYLSHKRTPDTITPLKEVSDACVHHLVQKSMVNLFIPELQIVCIGHDDFGFIILFQEHNAYLPLVEQLIKKHSLYLLKAQEY